MGIFLLLIFLTLCKSNGDSESGESPSSSTTVTENDDCPLGNWRNKIIEMTFQEVLQEFQSLGEEGEGCASMIWEEMRNDLLAFREATRAGSTKPKAANLKSSARSITLKGMMTAVGFNTEPPKFNKNQVQDIFDDTGMTEMQKKMMMYIYSAVMKGNDKREKEKMAWIMTWQNMKNKETPTQTCSCPFCPEELCPGCSKNEIITIQGGSNRVFFILGQYKYDPKIQTYVQMTNTTEHYDFEGEDNDLMVAISSVYLYRVARSGWYVGLAPGKTKGMLYNPTNSSSLPTTGWQYWGPLEVADKEEIEGETEWGWVTDSTLKITNGSYDWCDTIHAKGEGVFSLDCELFGKFTKSPDWATGRPVYINDHGAVLHASSGRGWKLEREEKVVEVTDPPEQLMSTLNPETIDKWSEEAEVTVTLTCSIPINTSSIIPIQGSR